MNIQVKAYIKHKAIVAYLDILGFSDLLRGDKWDEKVKAIFTIVNKSIDSASIKGGHGILPKGQLKSLFASDTIVLWLVPGDDSRQEQIKALRYMLHAVEKIQLNCALQNVWLRGGISFDSVLYDDKNIAGPGFIKALQLEKEAVYPRVLVDSAMVKDFLPEQRTQKECLEEINQTFGFTDYSGTFLYSFDGRACLTSEFREDYPFFVHYLNPLLREENKHITDVIWKNLRDSIYARSPQIHRKYKWVVEYIEHAANWYSQDNALAKRVSEDPIF